jgi:hypothetical protein
MGKILVIILATCACLWLAFMLVGTRLTNTAFNVPGTEHTPAFGVTWTIILGAGVGYVIYRIVKGK